MLRTSVLGSAVALAAVLSSTSNATATGPSTLALAELAAGDIVEITTDTGRYRFEMVNTTTGETRGQAAFGSDPYSRSHRVFVFGSTQGRDAKSAGMMLVEMHRIRVGMKLELGVRSKKDSDRHFTAQIKSIRVTPATQDQVAMLAR